MSAPLLPHESARLAALGRYGILDTPPEEAFDRVTRLAARVLNVPVALVNFVDRERQWSKACYGASPGEAPRKDAFCTWTVFGEDVLVVPNARQDGRFAQLESVQRGEIAFYAGAPLITPEGHVIGTLCVLDRQPRSFGPGDEETLRMLAALVMDELELRLRTQELVRARDHAQTLRDLAELMNEPLAPRDMSRRALALLHGRMALDWSGLLHLRRSGPSVISDRMGEGGAAFGLRLRRRLNLQADPLWAALAVRDRLFLDGAPAMRNKFPHLAPDELGSVAWTHLHVGGQGQEQEGPYVLLLARLRCPAPWTPEDRALLDAAARSVGIALERTRHVQALERAALTDALTGLGNRRALDTALDEADRRHRQTGLGYALGIVDLDGMKRVNDERGHEAGDTLLREFAGQLAAVPGLGAYRLGGDEYALLQRQTLPADDWAATARQELRRVVADAEQHVQAQGYPAGASLGVAVVPEDAPDATAALRIADGWMYIRKRQRRPERNAPVRVQEQEPEASR
ncbi:sensor domain-containing diguanylate cyclase [Deinococcus hopiensis]|uniref:sensor domain-containing diguanylate cyclase n=1 Tax=Deinococcus hopiensis TaxID=309885 RepID=UPI001483CEE9|nr:sensor domain-containing diguanylate cyclase [Deinococcus hopiensis]